jgi:acyl dehydratase
VSGPRYLEDFEIGACERFGRYPVSHAEVIAFAQRYDPQPFHIDQAAAEKSHFGGLIASGWHTAAMYIRMINDHGATRHALAGLGFDDMRWPRPTRPGDVLSVESTVKAKSPLRSRADRGIVTFATRILNQREEAVMTFDVLVLFPSRPQD